MAAITARLGSKSLTAKLSVPKKYKEEQERLKIFLTNINLYCRFNAAFFITN
jgi:hypothetical protein